MDPEPDLDGPAHLKKTFRTGFAVFTRRPL
jgi:hypothetical protein